ncbi:MAG: T9SS type A sorting domain-containing protein [Candidatus Electryonea clarkiae]|nr:T9SS type A sorting domain-containing protein [Candidatus Electryonea clarkiae]MDP8286660.1 T9SS type A sorting domain-containing protein [Candidatus Electryonea clarkiae]
MMKSTFYILFLFFLASNVCSQERLSGAQSDTLDPGEYIVEGDIWVESGILWYLRPGITLRFYDDVTFNIHGAFYAMGEENDSIRFEAYDEESAWSGLDFLPSGYRSYLNYCVITGSNEVGVFKYAPGGIQINHSRISNNSNRNGDVAGIRSRTMFQDSLSFTTISDNDGIGYYGDGTLTRFYYCTIKGNSNTGIVGDRANIYINNCIISYNNNSGLRNLSSSCYIDSSEFLNNQAENGGAIYSAGVVNQISRTLFSGNYARRFGGAIHKESEYDYLTVNNSVFIENQADSTGASIYAYHGIVINCIFTENGPSSNIFVSGDEYVATYNSLYYNNDGIDIQFTEPSRFSEEFGIIDSVNANADSCDQFSNLFIDPLFVNPQERNFHLRENSPCIDAGISWYRNNGPYNDPDGGLTDIGIHYYHVSEVLEQKRNRSIPSRFSVKDIYPNPFNSDLTITIALPYSSDLKVSVYNLLGKEVTLLANDRFTAGDKRFVFRGNNLPTGIYFIRSSVPGRMYEVKKVVLVR